MGAWRGVAVEMMMVAAAAGCASSTAVELDELEGRWEWTTASGGIAGRTITPASEGYTLEVRFLGDGTAELWRDGELRSTAEFQIALGRKDGSFPGADALRFAPALLGWEEMAYEIDGGDRLTLVDGCCDGYAYTFVRAGSAP